MSAPTRAPAWGADIATAARPRLEARLLGRAWLVPAIASAWVAVVLFLRWPALLHPEFISDSNLDSAFFAYAGELIRTGGVPYLAFWDHKAPLIHLLDAAVLSVSGGHLWGLWVFSLAVFVASVLLGHAAMRRVFGAVGALLGTTYFAFTLAGLLPANLTEGYVLPLQWAAAWLLVRWASERRRPLAFGAALGVLGAGAFLLRPNLIGGAASVGLSMVVTLLAERRGRASLALIGGVVCGAALVIVPIVAYLAHAGALPAFWDQAFRYNFIYAAAHWGARARAAIQGLTFLTFFGSAVVPLAGWALCARRLRMSIRERRLDPVMLLLVIWLPIELLLASTSGRPYAHYFATLGAPLAFLAAAFAADLASAAATTVDRGIGARLASVPALLAAATVLVAVTSTGLRLRDGARDRARGMQVAAVAEYVRANTPPGARLLVWGHAADVHFFSGRRPASRFVYPLALLTPGYADSALVAGFVNDLRAAAPPIIIDATPNAAKGEDLVPPLDHWDPDWHYPQDEGRLRWWTMTPALRAFYDYVAANYVATERVGPEQWVAYRLVDHTTHRSPGTGVAAAPHE